MGVCPRCGESESMQDSVLCPVCASEEERHLDVASTGAKQGELPYGWGRVQAGLLIAGGIGLLSQGSGGRGFSPFDAALNLVLGVCILRRNRLILPLMIITTVALILGIIVSIVTHDAHTGDLLGFALPIWVLYTCYYYNRRHEFNRWF
jgi:hypothetical protein